MNDPEADAAVRAEAAEPGATTVVDKSVVARSTRHTALAQGLSQLLRFLTSLVLARILTPHDFGVVAVAIVLTMLVDQLKDLGTSSALIQRPTVDRVLLNSVFFANVAVGAVVAGLMVVLAVPLAQGFGIPESAPVIRAFAAITFITALGKVHESMLRRTMQFRAVAVSTIANALVSTVVSVACAFAGMSYWAIVVGTGAGSVVGTVLFWRYERWRPGLQTSMASIRSIWRFSYHVSLVAILYVVWSQMDKLIVSRFLGTVSLGYYTMAQRLVNTPLTSIGSVIGQVTLPAFARRQDEHDALRAGLIRSSAIVALVTFPLMFGLAAVAEPLVPVVLGDNWGDVVPVIWILAPVGAVWSTTFNTDQLLLAKGRSDWSWRWGAVHLVVLGVLELLGTRWGMLGVAGGYAVGTVLLTPFTLLIALKPIGGGLRPFTLALWPYAWRATAMAGCVLAVVDGLGAHGSGDLVRLLAGLVTGVAVYGGLLLLGRPAAVGDALTALHRRTS